MLYRRRRGLSWWWDHFRFFYVERHLIYGVPRLSLLSAIGYANSATFRDGEMDREPERPAWGWDYE